MKYNDEQILNIEEYELMAKAYANELKKQGFRIVRIDNDQTLQLAIEIFELMASIKSMLFSLGGFLNTSQFYSLNERQLKKVGLMFDINHTPSIKNIHRDKTKCFLSFLSSEFSLIKKLIILSDQSNYESELQKIIDSRLSLLSNILSI